MKTIVINSRMYGTNAERLAMNLSASDTEIDFYETDTNNEYKWKGSEWIQMSINGAALVTIKSSDVIPPSENVTYFAFTLDGSAASQQILPDFQNYSEVVFKLTGLTTAKLGVQADLLEIQSGTIYTGDIGAVGYGVNPYTGTAATSLGNGSYRLEKTLASALRFYISTTSAGETATVTGMARGGA